MKHSNRYSPELRERAVRLVLDHQGAHESQWAAIGSVSSKIGCSAETLRKWVRQAERDEGVRPGLTSAEGERLKALERENRELRRANEILRKASAYFAPPLGDCTAITCRATGRSSTADPSHDVVHQFAPRAMWSSQHSTGSTGSTTDGSSSRSGTAHRPRPKRRTITNSNTRRWPRDSHIMVSGILGAVQFCCASSQSASSSCVARNSCLSTRSVRSMLRPSAKESSTRMAPSTASMVVTERPAFRSCVVTNRVGQIGRHARLRVDQHAVALSALPPAVDDPVGHLGLWDVPAKLYTFRWYVLLLLAAASRCI